MDNLYARLRFFLVSILLVMVLGTFALMQVENLSLVDAFYFNIVSIATVGYGDIHPTSQTGKLLAVVLILLGTGTFLGVIANATEIMLSRREQQTHLKKLHLLIGVYFSEAGNRLLSLCVRADPQHFEFCRQLALTDSWTEKDFQQAQKKLQQCTFAVDVNKIDFPEFADFLTSKRRAMIELLENPITLEHETFTEHLQAIFHLNEELAARKDLNDIPPSDRKHLGGDLNRAYSLLVRQWLSYIAYLKMNYPYLYSLAVRTNPFNAKASATVLDS